MRSAVILLAAVVGALCFGAAGQSLTGGENNNAKGQSQLAGAAAKFTGTLAASARTTTLATTQDWYQFLGPSRNGIIEGTKLASTWPCSGPTTLWSRPCKWGHAGPIVRNGLMILMDRPSKKEQPDGDESITALDALTGRHIWRNDYPCTFKGDQYIYGPSATPAASADKVVCLLDTGKLLCLELKTGKQVWEKDLETDFDLTKRGGHDIYNLSSSPLIVDDLVIVQVCAGGVGLLALKLSDGSEVWRTGAMANYGSSTGFMMLGDVPCVIVMPTARPKGFQGDVLGLNARTGEPLWYASAGKSYYNTPSPIAAEGRVFVEGGSGDGPTMSFQPPEDDSAKAKLLWKDEHMVRFSNYMGYRGLVFGQGFTGHPSPAGARMWCANPRDGTILWDRKSTQEHQWLIGSDGKVFQFHDKGELSMFDAAAREGYKELGRAKVIDHTWAFPALAGGRMYIRSNTQLICLDLRPQENIP